MVLGGWTVEFPVDTESQTVFDKVVGGLIGVKYDAIASATQVVNGENYLFIAKYTRATHPSYVGLAKIYATVSPAGSEPRLINIEEIISSPEHSCGGWMIHFPIDSESQAAFNEAFKGFVGSSYRPLVSATQVVNGVNYIFIAEYTTLGNPQTNGLAKIYITATPAGSAPHIVNIATII